MKHHFKIEDDLWWSTEVTIRDLAEYFNLGDGPGYVNIVFAPEGRDVSPLKDDEFKLIDWVFENLSILSKAVVEAILSEYPNLQESYEYSEEERRELMPDIVNSDMLRTLVGLKSIYIHPIVKDGIPYVGYEFGCTWDKEHGLGVLLHGSRKVEVGGADTSFLMWIAEEDAEQC